MVFHVKQDFDVIVVGAGHAGIEAANICSNFGLKTALISNSIDDIGQMSCNPSIGGVGKTHIAREVDAMGGLICKIGDLSSIHYRVLNLSKGPDFPARAFRLLIKQLWRYDKLVAKLEVCRCLFRCRCVDIGRNLCSSCIFVKLS